MKHFVLIKNITPTRLIPIIFFLCACTSLPSHSKSENLSILEHSGFQYLEKTLFHLVRERMPESQGIHHFYIPHYKKGEYEIYMLWKEKRMLWGLSIGGNNEDSWYGTRLPRSGLMLDLDTDVVATQKEIGSSTYLVSQSWVSQKVYDAVVNGDLVEIDINKLTSKYRK